MLSQVPQQPDAYQAAQLDDCHREVGELLCACARLAVICRWAGPVSTLQCASAVVVERLASMRRLAGTAGHGRVGKTWLARSSWDWGTAARALIVALGSGWQRTKWLVEHPSGELAAVGAPKHTLDPPGDQELACTAVGSTMVDLQQPAGRLASARTGK